jgi:hypothetical protein
LTISGLFLFHRTRSFFTLNNEIFTQSRMRGKDKNKGVKHCHIIYNKMIMLVDN